MEKHKVRPAIPESFQQVADGDAVRSQVSKILSSPGFQRSERLRRFLAYVVEETLAGRGDKLKEYTIAPAVLDRPSHDPDVDSIIRVENFDSDWTNTTKLLGVLMRFGSRS